jgi:ornithine carbamoyltransferase
MKRDFLSVIDLSQSEMKDLFELSLKLKKSSGEKILEGKEIALIFEKPSLRTRVTFEAAIYRLGGKPIYLSPQDIQLGKREAVKDVARNLSLWVSGIVARVFSHRNLEELAGEASVPVINALSDLEHPCQALADFLSIYEVKGDFDIHLVFVGDGNNVASSLMLLSSVIGTRFTLVCPEGYEVPKAIWEKAKEMAGEKVKMLRDPKEGVRDADFIYTDVWTSMGQEAERELRMRVFRPYQVNEELLSYAPKHAKIMHCLPAHRGEEITDGVLDSDRSIVLLQAENRLYTEMALFYAIYQG